jgi:hypothetical protein
MTSAYKLMFGILGEHYSGQTHIFIFIMGWGWKVVWDNVVQSFLQTACLSIIVFPNLLQTAGFLARQLEPNICLMSISLGGFL